MPHATVPSPGLQALILCGPGSSLSTFTSNPSDFPKAIVPIANRPMVWYPLEWCYRMGVSDITLITPPESKAALESSLATNPALTSLPSPKPEVLAPSDLTQTTGTAELLRLPEVQKCLTSDFIVLPCDLISELDGTHLLQQWMTLNPLSSHSQKADSKRGGLAVFYPIYGLESISTKKDETDFLATVPLPSPVVPLHAGSLRPNIEAVVLNMPTDTLNDKVAEGPSKGFYRLRHSLLSKFGKIAMRMKHRDAHVYVFPLWVKEFVMQNDQFESISEDVLGWWAKSGWQEGLAQKLGLDGVLHNTTKKGRSTSHGANSEGSSPEHDRMAEDGEADIEPDDVDLKAMSSTKATRPPAPETQTASRVGIPIPLREKRVEVPQLLAYVQPASSSPLIRRVDTSAQLRSVSLYLAKQALDHPLSPELKVHGTAHLEQQSRVSQEDCLIAENVKIGFRANIKESVIGANCEIGRNVRMTKCLLMDGCVVGDGVQLTDCTLGRRAKVLGMKPAETPSTPTTQVESSTQPAKKGKKKAGVDDDEEDRTKLTDCEVAPGFVVEAGTEAKGEKFMGFDTDSLGLGDDEDDEDEEMTATETEDESFTA